MTLRIRHVAAPLATLLLALSPAVAQATTTPSPTATPGTTATTSPVVPTPAVAPTRQAPTSAPTQPASAPRTATATVLPDPHRVRRHLTARMPSVAIASITCAGQCPTTWSQVSGHGSWAVRGVAKGIRAGSPVDVYRAIGSGGWAKVASTTVTSAGTWVLPTLPVTYAGSYRWKAVLPTAPVSDADGVVASAEVVRTVAPVASTIRPSSSYLSTATSMLVSGTMSTFAAGRAIRIERSTPSGWVAVGTTTAAADGFYRLTTTLGTNTLTTYTFRAAYPTPNGPTAYSPTTSLGRVLPADSVRLTDAQARGVVTSLGIPVRSSGGCSTRSVRSCTSLDTIRTATIREVVTLKRGSSCALAITGGTEVGHATGTYSHYNGYKIDLAMSACLTGYIKGHSTYRGGPYWFRSPTLYYNEISHWDLKVDELG